jgi:hypothetical protein
MLKKNSVWLGMGIGFAAPLVLLGIIYLLGLIFGPFAMEKSPFVCVTLNIVPVRYYFITAGLDRTGGGLLTMTVILIILVTMIHL